MAGMTARRRDPSDRGVEQAIVGLKKGAYLLKCPRRGKPKFRPFRLSTDENFLIWYTGEEEKQLRLTSVTKIVRGQSTVNFVRHRLPEKECQSFSLIYQNGERSLDLICKDKEQADSWYLGLNSLISISRHCRSVAIFRNNRGSHTCANSPIRCSWRKHNLDHLIDSARSSQVHSLCESPPQSLLQRHFSVGLSYSFHSPRSSTPRPTSSSQTVLERRLSHLPQMVYHSYKEKRSHHHLNKEHNKNSITKIKPSFSISTLRDDNDVLKDIFVWGEGVEGRILGGGSEKYGTSGIVFDALLPRLLESTGKLDVRGISCGRDHAAIVTKQGEVFCWGNGNGGKLGHKTNMDVPNPKVVESLAEVCVDAVVCGANQTLALTSSGKLYAWGDGGFGGEFSNDGRNRSQWIPHTVCGPLEGIFISKVACGEWHTAIITSTGQLFTFGDGYFGALGHGDLQNAYQPKEVEFLKGLRVKSVACGPWHTAAIVEIMVGRYQNVAHGGKLFTWGDNDKGKLGHADKEKRLLPACVASLVDCDFVQVSCGDMLTVALSVTGIVFTMGSSDNGQLGNPQSEEKSITSVEGELRSKHVKQISSGSSHVVVLTTTGEVYSWGKGANGRLGLGDTEDRNSPTLVESLKDRQVESVACGSSFTTVVCLHKSILSCDQSICSGCKMFFSFTRKKHNCYHCGFAFCHSCTSKRSLNASLAPNKSKRFRVCDSCFVQLNRMVEFGSKSEIQTPRALSWARKRFSDPKPESEELLLVQPSSFSPYSDEQFKTFERQTSVKHGRNQDLQRSSRTQKWGEVSCPPQFTALHGEYSKSSFPLSSDELPNLSSTFTQQSPQFLKPMKSIVAAAKPDFCETDKMLAEELQRLQAEVQNLTKQCQMKNETLLLYKKRIDETWTIARDEAAKCKAAKDIIKILTSQMNATDGKFSAGREMNSLKSLLCEKLDIRSPQIRPIQAELLGSENAELFSSSNSLSFDNQLLKHGKVSQLSEQVIPSSDISRNHSRLPGSNIKIFAKKEAKGEWVEQDEPGVYITLLRLPNGKKGINRVRFSRRHFSENEAERWWEENQRRVYLKYDIERSTSSETKEGG